MRTEAEGLLLFGCWLEALPVPASTASEAGFCNTSVPMPLLPYCALLSVVKGVPAGGGRSLMTGLPLLSLHRYIIAASVGCTSKPIRHAVEIMAVHPKAVGILNLNFNVSWSRYCDLAISAISHVVNAQHFLTFLQHLFTMSIVTRTATANDEYPHPLAHPHDGIVMRAVCGFRLVRLRTSGSTLRYPAGRPIHGFRDRCSGRVARN